MGKKSVRWSDKSAGGVTPRVELQEHGMRHSFQSRRQGQPGVCHWCRVDRGQPTGEGCEGKDWAKFTSFWSRQTRDIERLLEPNNGGDSQCLGGRGTANGKRTRECHATAVPLGLDPLGRMYVRIIYCGADGNANSSLA